MPRRPIDSRPGSLFALLAFLLVIGAVFGAAQFIRKALRPASSRRDTALAPADSTARMPVQLQRIAERPGGGYVLEAIEASGGWEAWSSRETVSFGLEGFFFGPLGEVAGSRSETCTIRLVPPMRVRIEANDGSQVVGFGRAGAWGAGRQSDGRWNSALGPGAMDRDMLRHLAVDAAWVFSLPFNLGDVDAMFAGEAVKADGDSLIRLDVVYPPAPGDTASRTYRLGFDPDSGHILEVFYRGRGMGSVVLDEPSDEPRTDAPADDPGADEPDAIVKDIPGTRSGTGFVLTLRGYTEFEGLWRPTRRILFEADEAGHALRRIYEQRLGAVTWNAPISGDLFEPPPAP